MELRKSLGLAAAFALMLSGAPAFAQSNSSNSSGSNNGQPGVTSGPAAGSAVEPSTATEKRAGYKASTAVGAPGMAAKKGSESGKTPPKPDQK